MEYKLLIFTRIISICLCLYIVYRAKKNSILEKESMHWLFMSLLMVFMAFFPRLLETISGLMGIQYPPAALFLISTIILFILLFRQFGKITVLNNKIGDLIRTVAILEYEIAELRSKSAKRECEAE